MAAQWVLSPQGVARAVQGSRSALREVGGYAYLSKFNKAYASDSVECKLHLRKLTGGKRAHRKAGTLAGAPAGSPEGPKEAADNSRHRAPKGRRGQRRAGGDQRARCHCCFLVP